MIIDVHVHICPPEVRKSRERFLEGEPEFAQIYQDPKAKLVGARELIKRMDQDQVDKAVVFGFPWRKKRHFTLNNNYILAAAQEYPDRLLPFCCLDASHKDARLEVERCLEAGARGVGELGFYVTGLDQGAQLALSRIIPPCSEANVPILLHTNEPVGHTYPGKSPMTLSQLYQLLKRFPKTKWILAHLGGGLPFFAWLKKEVTELLANCWFDLAAMPFLYKPQALVSMVKAIGANHFLLGTDFPLLTPQRYYKDLAKTSLTQEEKQMILGINAQQLLVKDEPTY